MTARFKWMKATAATAIALVGLTAHAGPRQTANSKQQTATQSIYDLVNQPEVIKAIQNSGIFHFSEFKLTKIVSSSPDSNGRFWESVAGKNTPNRSFFQESVSSTVSVEGYIKCGENDPGYYLSGTSDDLFSSFVYSASFRLEFFKEGKITVMRLSPDWPLFFWTDASPLRKPIVISNFFNSRIYEVRDSGLNATEIYYQYAGGGKPTSTPSNNSSGTTTSAATTQVGHTPKDVCELTQILSAEEQKQSK